MPQARTALFISVSLVAVACAPATTSRYTVNPPAKPATASPSSASSDAGQNAPAAPPASPAISPSTIASPTGLAYPGSAPDTAPSTEYFGGGASLQKGASESSSAIRFDPRRGVELAFVDADIRRVVDAILGDALSLNYSVDPQVQGTITLRTAKPVARESLIPALEAALATVNAAIVRRDNVYSVVPRSVAQSGAALMRPLTARERALPGYALEILPLQYASAKEAAKLLTGSGAKDAVLQIDEVRNQLIIAGSSQERAAIRRLIDSVDIDWVRGMSFALYRLEAVKPEEITQDLERIFKPPMDVLGSRIRLIPLPRMNAILGVAARQQDLRQMETWIRRLDVGADQNTRRLYIYNVQNGRARDIAASLQLVMGGGSSSETISNPSSSSSSSIGSTVSGTGGLGTSLSGQGQSLNQASQLQSSASSPSTTSTMQIPTGNTLRIVPDEGNNSLLLYATPSEYDFVIDALKQLDVMPRQIMIEAVLAEVTLNDDLRYGLQWSFTPGDNQITLSTSENGGVSSTFPGFSYVYTGWADARIVLNALQSKTNVKVLSSPKLVVLNNQTATLQVGDQVPIITQSSQGVSDPDAPIVNKIEMKDTGVILKVTPRANDNGLVVLDISQEVSDVAATTTSGIDSPTIQQRKFASTVAGRSGSTIALGGLIRETQTKSNSGVPLLKDIPILGNAFKNNTNNGRRTELIVLLTPTVMRDARETEQSINDLIEGFHAVRPIVDNIRHGAEKTPAAGQP